MTERAILVPFKANCRKSRLSGVLTQEERKRLSELMLLDVLEALRKAGALPISYVVSSDRGALALSRKAGARTISERRDRGVNAAVIEGVTALPAVDDFVVVPSDLPLLSSAELRKALLLERSFGCVLAPSRSFNGTNLFAFPRRLVPILSYDSNSFWNHVRGAAKEGVSLAVCCGTGIISDIDSAKDLALLAGSRSRASSAEFAKEALARRPS